MRLVKMADASDPTKLPATGVDIVAGYIGGDTPHVWPDKQWDLYKNYRKVPIFVRSNIVGSSGGEADAFTALQALYTLRVPQGNVIIYDRETNTDVDATLAFGEVMQWAHYHPMPYGSIDNLFQHPILDGYWVADPTNVPHMYAHPHVLATQYTFNDNGYDYSDVDWWLAKQRMKVW